MFHAGWSAGAGLDGAVMVRDPDTKASAGDMRFSVSVGLVCPNVLGPTGTAEPRDGSRSVSDPVAAAEKECPLHDVREFTGARSAGESAARKCPDSSYV
ncbi:hypothetical protein NWFMUON74_02860 [Nocardia wallacei]|uniref:Uncharacterized protein n=1 Tax=Nocardia wallacei TaxID=480035 RepID=A0A7G1KGI2_9NOCA|nr:hypothetical protein NWFMUON74_02860 [Nocardia wallacei]